jgi:RND family efflux transporter MFP subunit
MPVEIVTLAAKPSSRPPNTSRLEVASLEHDPAGGRGGARQHRGAIRQQVSKGTLLFEIDSAPQQSALASLQSMRPSRESDVEFARQQVIRNRTLLLAGAISQREVEQFEAQLRSAEAQLKALDEQIKQQGSQLAYYRVTAPIAGTVGDIQVNVGDRVTRTTVLTTIDENDTLEVYINVPVPQAPQLKLGLPVRLVDDRGQILATNKITFISPNVDTAMQSVLAKAQLVEGRGQYRSDQFVRARIVWTTAPGPDDSGHRGDAHQRAVLRVRAEKTARGCWPSRSQCSFGEIVGNDYVVQSGPRTRRAVDRLGPAEDS